jgi:hypothetical protein
MICEITYSEDLVVTVCFVNVPDHVIVRKSGTRFGPRCAYEYHCTTSGVIWPSQNANVRTVGTRLIMQKTEI